MAHCTCHAAAVAYEFAATSACAVMIPCVAATGTPTAAPTPEFFTLIQTGCSGTISNVEEDWSYEVSGQTATITGGSIVGTISANGNSIDWNTGFTYSRVMTGAPSSRRGNNGKTYTRQGTQSIHCD